MSRDITIGGKLDRTSRQADPLSEYQASTADDALELLYNQYLQAAYLARTKEREAPVEQQQMATLLSTVIEQNHKLYAELLQTTRNITTLQNKSVLDEQLDLQVDSLKNFDAFGAAVEKLKSLSEGLESKRHALELNKITQQTGDFTGILKEIEATTKELTENGADFAQPITRTTAMTTVLEQEAAALKDCNESTVAVERLAGEAMSLDINSILNES